MLRLLLAIPFAAAVSMGLFAFMAWMVNHNDPHAQHSSEPLSFQLVMVEQEPASQRRQRAIPPPPQTPEPPVQIPLTPLTQQQTTVSLGPMSIQPLGLDNAIKGMNIRTPKFGIATANQQALPIYRAEPSYPPRALQRGIEGYVLLRFTIDATGRPVDIEVVEAKPRRVFERDAMLALRNWKYQPMLVDGQAVTQPGQTVKLEFRLAQ